MGVIDDCRARIARAHECFQRVMEEFVRLPDDAKSIGFRSNFDAEANQITVVVDRVPLYPAHWRLLFSEGIHHLRSTLDNLVWELANWNLKSNGETREPLGCTKYPVAIEKGHFNRGWLKDLHPAHLAIIEALQPYGDIAFNQEPESVRNDPVVRTAMAHNHPLQIIHSLNIADKHRILNPVAFIASGIKFNDPATFDCSITFLNVFLLNEIHVGAQWCVYDVTVQGPDPRVEVRDEVALSIGLNGRNILPDLSVLVGFVTAVVDQFASVLS